MHEYLFGINQELCRLKRELPHLDILEVCRRGYVLGVVYQLRYICSY